ncbi:hypothetical protein F5B21DRAFT_473938, partial [Xylaria acuta]
MPQLPYEPPQAPAPLMEGQPVKAKGERHVARLPKRKIPRVVKSNPQRRKRAGSLASNSKRRPQPCRHKGKSKPLLPCEETDMPPSKQAESSEKVTQFDVCEYVNHSTEDQMGDRRNKRFNRRPLGEFMICGKVSSEGYQVDVIKDSIETEGQVKYLVKWQGWPAKKHWTWEPFDNLDSDGAKAEAKQFHQRNPGKPADLRAL